MLAVGKELPVGVERELADHDSKAGRGIPHAGARHGVVAQHAEAGAQAGALVFGYLQPMRCELLDSDFGLKIRRQHRCQWAGVAHTPRQNGCERHLESVGHRVSLAQTVECNPGHGLQAVTDGVRLGRTVGATGGLRVAPGAVQQPDLPALNDVQPGMEACVALGSVFRVREVVNMLGPSVGQRPIGAKKADRRLLQPRPAAVTCRHFVDLAGGETEKQSLVNAHRVVLGAPRVTQGRLVGLCTLQQADRPEEGGRVRVCLQIGKGRLQGPGNGRPRNLGLHLADLVDQRFDQRLTMRGVENAPEGGQKVGRRPKRVGHLRRSARSTSSRLVTTNELIDT